MFSDPEYCANICEFTVPIKLKVPILIEPIAVVKTVEPVREKVHIHLESDLYLSPAVTATPAICVLPNGYSRHQLPGSQNPQ